jgi:hypothetical protein
MSKVALDLESVLADTMSEALTSTDKLDESAVRGNWNMPEEQFQIYLGVTDALWRHNPLSISPVEPSIDRYVDKISDKHEVHVVTGRQHVDESLLLWLENHEITFEQFRSTGENKWTLNEYDVFIDDNPEMVGECRLLLRDQPWNQHIDTTEYKSCDRIYSLAEAVEFL